jgi:putative membrane protein
MMNMLSRFFWNSPDILLPASMLTISLISAGLFYSLAQIPFIDRLIISKNKMSVTVRNRAVRFFMENGVCDTKERSGVLLFISVLERRVELIADSGINKKISPDTWDRIVSSMIRGIKEKKTAEAIEKAVLEIGEILAEHFSGTKNNKNELSNGPVELGRGS